MELSSLITNVNSNQHENVPPTETSKYGGKENGPVVAEKMKKKISEALVNREV